jgi:Uma2 family endonuclease
MHERLKSLIGRLIETLASILDIEIASYGSTTLLLKVARRGLEPDECYYVQNEPHVRGKGDVDLETDPPPDLVIEVELSRSALDKFVIYQSLGVPEIWRFDGTELKVHLRAKDGDYRLVDSSAAFPLLPLDGLQEFLSRWKTSGETRLVREFAEWVRSWVPR